MTRPRLFGFGLVLASLAFAACGHSNSTPTVKSTATPVPTPTGSAPASLSSPCASSLGIAYEPDGGNGKGFNGIQVTHFEDNNENLCAAVLPTSATGTVQLDASVGPFAVSQDVTDSVALLFNPSSNGYSYVQDIFGIAVGQIVPAGTPYNLSVPATPIPTVSASASATASPSAAPALITNGTSEAILGDSSAGVALTVSPNTSPQGIVALTSLTNSPPQYGNYVPFASSAYTLKSPVGTSFDNIRTLTYTSSTSTTVTQVLVRGTNDLLSVYVTPASTGYTFNVEAEDTNLGSNVPLLGYGRMAINPGSPSHALVGGTSSGNASTLTLVTGLPTAITESSTLTLPGTITSIQFVPGYGTYAVVGTTAGIVVVGGTTTSALTLLTPFSGQTAYTPTFTDCNGHTQTLTNIASVAFSTDLRYLVALGTASGVSCPSGYNGTLIAVPFTATAGSTPAPSTLPTPTAAPAGSPSPSPFPTFLQQNNVIPPPANADYLVVH